MWPDWAIFWTLGNFLSLWKQLICPNLSNSLEIFVNVSKSFIFLVKSFLGNFYRHLGIFLWSHCSRLRFNWAVFFALAIVDSASHSPWTKSQIKQMPSLGTKDNSTFQYRCFNTTLQYLRIINCQCDLIWLNFATLAKTKMSFELYLTFGKNCYQLRQILFTIGQFFTDK